MGQAVVQPQQHAGAAAHEVGQLVNSVGVKPEVRLVAARTILEMAIKAVELEDIQARLERLEALDAQKHA